MAQEKGNIGVIWRYYKPQGLQNRRLEAPLHPYTNYY